MFELATGIRYAMKLARILVLPQSFPRRWEIDPDKNVITEFVYIYNFTFPLDTPHALYLIPEDFGCWAKEGVRLLDLFAAALYSRPPHFLQVVGNYTVRAVRVQSFEIARQQHV